MNNRLLSMSPEERMAMFTGWLSLCASRGYVPSETKQQEVKEDLGLATPQKSEPNEPPKPGTVHGVSVGVKGQGPGSGYGRNRPR